MDFITLTQSNQSMHFITSANPAFQADSVLICYLHLTLLLKMCCLSFTSSHNPYLISIFHNTLSAILQAKVDLVSLIVGCIMPSMLIGLIKLLKMAQNKPEEESTFKAQFIEQCEDPSSVYVV